MDNKAIQLQTSNNNLPAIDSAATLAVIRMDEEKYPHYRNIPQLERMKLVAGEIQFLASIMRIKDFDKREPVLMATALDDMMREDKDMMELTMAEISVAFKNGVFGLYGEFFGLTAPNLFGFLNSFLESSLKREATDMVIKSRKQAYLERTAAEREERQRKIQAEIEEAKRNGTFVPTGRAWFEPKTVKDVMKESAEHRDKVRKQAREILNQHEEAVVRSQEP